MTAVSRVGASRARRALRLGVAGLFTASGVLHLVKPAAFDDFLPGWTPNPVAVNAAAGAVELVCAYGLLAGRRWAGPASAAALLAVWPSNLWFALDATAQGGATSPKAAVAWARMPLQLPMIWAVLAPLDDAAQH
jgi:uncharacterized membrane protein